MSNSKLATTLRQYAEQRVALAKEDDTIQVPGRPRVFSESPLLIVVYPERNIRPIDRATVEKYKAKFRRGEVPPAIDVAMENGKPVLQHGYHRTIAAQEVMQEDPEGMGHLQLEMREFKGNNADRIIMMLTAQDALEVDHVSRAEGYHTLIKQGLPIAKIAERIDKSVEHINQNLLIVEADEVVKQLIRDDRVKSTAVITLIKEEKQGGMPHGKAVAEMIKNAELLGKTNATLKHRAPKPASNKPASNKPKFGQVRASLKSLTTISGSLRDALSTAGVAAEAADDNAMVALSLPAAKVAELLALLESEAAPIEEQSTDTTQEQAQ